MTLAHRGQEPLDEHPALLLSEKATDACAEEPEPMARFVTDKGFTSRFEYTLQALKEVPYNKWRVYDPENTMRFFALRLHEAGMIKSTPQKSIAQGTD